MNIDNAIQALDAIQAQIDLLRAELTGAAPETLTGQCTGVDRQGRTCVREAHSDEVRHRYVATKESQAQEAAQARQAVQDARRWEEAAYVEIATGIKAVPTHRVVKGDIVKVEGQRGRWKVLAIEVSKDDPSRANIEVKSEERGNLRIFASHKMTLARPKKFRSTQLTEETDEHDAA